MFRPYIEIAINIKLISMNRLSPKKFILGCSGSILFTLLLCAGAFIWWLNATEYVGYVSPDFCTPRDELYQTINDNAQDWFDWLKELPRTSFPTIHFFTPSGRENVVSGEYLRSLDAPYFFVSIQQKYPNSPMGTRGYMYIVSDKPPDFNSDYMKVIYVGGKIYCYERLKD